MAGERRKRRSEVVVDTSLESFHKPKRKREFERLEISSSESLLSESDDDSFAGSESSSPNRSYNGQHNRKLPVRNRLGSFSRIPTSRPSKSFNFEDKQHRPAELFRTDLISAMKMADSDHLKDEEYWIIADSWRQEWEKGVQVPVNADQLNNPSVRSISSRIVSDFPFKLPKKLLHYADDERFTHSIHELDMTPKLSEEVCRYDLDELDVAWLQQVNYARFLMGKEPIEEYTMELAMECIENLCHENMEETRTTAEGFGIEYDDDVVCDVCQAPDSEDTNEMVFCDGCNLCVHQACYGVVKIPEGQWYCKPCSFGVSPTCALCPHPGGALKQMSDKKRWAHVSCALWIPETNFGDAEKMEPINGVDMIPASRWQLICSVCRERAGACIQCSVKACKVAYHVTCAIKEKLDMETVLETDGTDVKLKSLCKKHARKKINSPRKQEGSPKKMTAEEQANARKQKIREMEEHFYEYATVEQVSAKLASTQEDPIDFILKYWILKRKSHNNKPLLTPRRVEEDLLGNQQRNHLASRMRLFIHLRQNLERARNLCYMIVRREKVRRQFFRVKSDIFQLQSKAVTDSSLNKKDQQSVRDANNQPDCVYDFCTPDELPTKTEAATPTSVKLQSLSKGHSVKRVAERLSKAVPISSTGDKEVNGGLETADENKMKVASPLKKNGCLHPVSRRPLHESKMSKSGKPSPRPSNHHKAVSHLHQMRITSIFERTKGWSDSNETDSDLNDFDLSATQRQKLKREKKMNAADSADKLKPPPSSRMAKCVESSHTMSHKNGRVPTRSSTSSSSSSSLSQQNHLKQRNGLDSLPKLKRKTKLMKEEDEDSFIDVENSDIEDAKRPKVGHHHQRQHQQQQQQLRPAKKSKTKL